MSFHTDVLRSASPVSEPLPSRIWAGSGAESVLLLLVGAVLGPQGLSILNTHVLDLIDPAVTAAVTILGVAVASDVIAPKFSTWREVRLRAVVPIVLLGAIAALLLAVVARFVGTVDVERVLSNEVQGCGAALLVSAAGVLLLASVTADTERRVLQIAVILLLSGIADFLSQPAFIVGIVAGAFWRWRGGAAGDAMRQDLAYVERPLMALVLVIAGARVDLSTTVWAMAAVYVALDVPLVRVLHRRAIATPLIPVAITLDMVRAAGPAVWPLVSIVVVGSIGSQLLAPLLGSDAKDDVAV